MKWRGRSGSSNVDDRRGRGGRGGAGLGIGGLVIVILFTLLTGGDLGDVIGNISMMGGTSIEQKYEPTQQEEELAEFSKVVFKDTEDVWNGLFEEMGEKYVEPGLVLYTDSVNSGCGYASAQIGPFYCPADGNVYIDLSFYKDLNDKFGAAGDFAFAYVIAHEVGHHVQNLYGISGQVQSLRSKLSQSDYNKYSVAMELQADYLAGVFAAHQRDKGYLDVGDVEEAINAAGQIGDDNIQRQTQGYVVPDSFTHGTGAQRKEWFERGYNAGDLSDWNTFKALGL
ncbi:MAG: neutral zinc metallopeptidase [Peptoniphilus sp.]|nr:neutral zinc metallopeptidase [Peptoniphilus sp.]